MRFRRKSKYPIVYKEPAPLALRISRVVIVLLLVLLIAIIFYFREVINNKDHEIALLRAEYSKLENIVSVMNISLANVANLLGNTCCIPSVFEHALNLSEVINLSGYMTRLNLSGDNVYDSIEKIYSWIRENIIWTEDQYSVAVNSTTCILIMGKKYCYYDFKVIREHVQSPSITLERRSGDCEDMAILLYASLDYYFKYIAKEQKTPWFAIVVFHDETKHATVIIPEKSKGILIIDPSGKYITANESGYIEPREVFVEFSNYDQHWKIHGGIKYVAVYEINTTTGSHRLICEGPLDNVISDLEKMLIKK